nr:uncharacterized protein LOC117156923 [Bombus vancouverensis nearcticus]
MDGVIECLSYFVTSSTSAVKVLNMHFNKRNFSKMYQLVAKQWEHLKLNNELHVLEKVVMQGNRMAHFYRNTLVSFMVLFLLVPLTSPILDIVHPINGTRKRQQLLRVNYIFFNSDDYFFYIYLQLFWSTVVVVLTIVGADWLYMLIIHHSSGLFAVCGYQIQKATANLNYFSGEKDSDNSTYEKFRNCVIMHKEAIQFYNILDESSQSSYLIQVGLNILSISTAAVQTVVNLDRPEEAIRSAVFCGACQFHLFLLSLPGQVLLDHSSDLADNIYSSKWYKAPVQIQKVLYMMQIRCRRFCSLTAGGLYEMNIENFGITFKTCISYITMLMSMKDLHQKTGSVEILHVTYYNKLERYIQLLGQDPRHKSSTRNMIVIIVVTSIVSITIPTTIELFASLHKKDMDGVIECLPHFVASSISAVKVLNIHFNKRNFSKLFQLVARQWQQLKFNDELHVLEEVVMQGNRMAHFYRMFTIIGADWLYMLIIHHSSGLFAVCGHRVQKATVNPNNSTGTAISENYTYERIRNCTIMHNEAIRFSNILKESSQASYLIQVGLNMLSISATAVQVKTIFKMITNIKNSFRQIIVYIILQTVINLDRPEEAIRSAVFCGACLFHLLLLSLPGQVLLDHCSDLADNIYSSKWYKVPVQIQKVLYVMQIRCKRFCSLTAGGLYEMNIENFGITFKTCMSYITMMMSVKN